MRFLVDECTGPAVARWLRAQGHQVFSVYEQARGMADEAVIRKAFTETWILVTNDKGFGEMIYREQQPHHGVVLLRLDDERATCKIEALQRLIEAHASRLADKLSTQSGTESLCPDTAAWSGYTGQ